jgi:hypothetical protein
MAGRLSERAWSRIIATALITIVMGWLSWNDSHSIVYLRPHGKATFYRGGFFGRQKFELSQYRGVWQFSRSEPFETGELSAPFEYEYNDYLTLRLEEGGKVYLVDEKRMTREELRIVDGEWSYAASDHWQSIFEAVEHPDY